MQLNYPVMQYFDYHGASHLLRSAKPFADVYHKMEQLVGASAPEILLIDDREKNIFGAKLAGWQTIHLTSPGKLQTELNQRYPSLLGR
jgi:HAD superfamily hydrolase (TIGR01509 family)